LVKPSFWRNPAELSLDAGNIVLGARDVRLQVGDAVQVLLVVAVLGTQFLRLPVVVYLEQFRVAGFGLLEFRFQDRTGSGVALALVARVQLLPRATRLRRRGDTLGCVDRSSPP
jgi:hypothetical protein